MSTENSDNSSKDQDNNASIRESPTQEDQSLEGQISHNDEEQINKNDTENSLIVAVQRIIKINGAEFSIGAIRDLGDIKTNIYDAKSAVSTFSNLGYQSNFGKIKIKKLKPSHCPCITFDKDGYAIVIESISEKGIAKPGRNRAPAGQRLEWQASQRNVINRMTAPSSGITPSNACLRDDEVSATIGRNPRMPVSIQDPSVHDASLLRIDDVLR